MKFFLTGATGNVGRAIITNARNSSLQIEAGVHHPTNLVGNSFFDGVQAVPFDFANLAASHIPHDADLIFLMRPPQIVNVKIFADFFAQCKDNNPHIIFLSIQGAEQKEYTPHRKIERKIMEAGLPYTFIRPSYFMDNLITTLYAEIKKNRRIYLPAGHMKLNWFDVDDLGALIVKVAKEKDLYRNRALEITGLETLDFHQVVDIINPHLSRPLRYENPNLFRYILHELRYDKSWPLIAVMLLLHWLPKFGKAPLSTNTFAEIMGREPHRLEEFVDQHCQYFA